VIFASFVIPGEAALAQSDDGGGGRDRSARRFSKWRR
jgi:hypothetical protein